MGSYKPVVAAKRVLDVLAAVNRLKDKATLAEIHALTGIDKSTVVRMLETLADAGYVVREPACPNYLPTGKTLTLSSAFDRHTEISQIIERDLFDFRQQIDWPSDVAIFDRDAMLVIKSSRQSLPLSFVRSSGFRAPMLATSLGLAYLAHCPERERTEFLALAARGGIAWSELAQPPERLAAMLKKIRECGYATMQDGYSRIEYESKFSSIGVPIMTKQRLFGSINVMYLRSVLTQSAAVKNLLAPLQSVAKKMAAKMAKNIANG